MSRFYLYDDLKARSFEPFALTRPCGEMRAGALLIRDRFGHALGVTCAGHLTSEHLNGFDEPNAAGVIDGGVIPAGSWIVNSRFAPALKTASHAGLLEADGQCVGVLVNGDIPTSRFADGALDLAELPHLSRDRHTSGSLAGHWINEIWDFIGHLSSMLEADLAVLGEGMSSTIPAACIRVGEKAVYVEDGAIIEDAVCFDTSAGAIYLSAGSHVHAFTRLVGPLYVGPNSSVTADRIAASSIGDTCKVHGELSNTIFTGHSNKGHDGFVGHSILGRWVNLGAGTITSNLKNTYGSVSLWTPQGVRDSGLQFLGTMFGDHAKTGIGLRLTTGSVLGAGANVYGSEMPPKVVAPFAWGETGAFSEYREDKFLDVAERVMGRRHVELSTSARTQLSASYAQRWKGAG